MNPLYVQLGILVSICTLIGVVVKLTTVIVSLKVIVEQFILPKMKEYDEQIDKLNERDYENAVRNPSGRGRQVRGN